MLVVVCISRPWNRNWSMIDQGKQFCLPLHYACNCVYIKTMKCWVFVVSPRHSSLKLTETISHNLPPDICLHVNQGLSRYMGAKMYISAVTQTLIVMKTSCFLYDVYWRCLYLCFEECFEEFSAMVWLFLCRLGIWIHRVLCHVIYSICLWKCFGFVSFSKSNIKAGFSKAGFLQVFKAMDWFQMCQWGVSIEEAEVRCIDRKNTCHQCFICRELLKFLIAFRCGCEAADVKW